MVLGVDAQEFPGGLLRLDPPLRMSSLLPHDLCHGRSSSRWLPAALVFDILVCFLNFVSIFIYIMKLDQFTGKN